MFLCNPKSIWGTIMLLSIWFTISWISICSSEGIVMCVPSNSNYCVLKCFFLKYFFSPKWYWQCLFWPFWHFSPYWCMVSLIWWWCILFYPFMFQCGVFPCLLLSCHGMIFHFARGSWPLPGVMPCYVLCLLYTWFVVPALEGCASFLYGVNVAGTNLVRKWIMAYWRLILSVWHPIRWRQISHWNLYTIYHIVMCIDQCRSTLTNIDSPLVLWSTRSETPLINRMWAVQRGRGLVYRL